MASSVRRAVYEQVDQQSSDPQELQAVRSSVPAVDRRAVHRSFSQPASLPITASQLTVIIPTLNEERAIGVLLEQLSTCYQGLQILVVDDASTDSTGEIVDSFSRSAGDSSVRLLSRKDASIRGITASVLEALQALRTDYFVVMDGDLQHPPSVIADMQVELTDGADVVAASRLPYVEQQPLHRVAMTKLATSAASVVLRRKGLGVSDPMSGLFAARTEVVRDIVSRHGNRFELGGYKVLFDILRCADSRNLRLAEVFYEFGVRSGGSSKLRPIHAFYFLRSVFR